MAIEKKNTYVPGTNNDITNAVANIDINRLGMDKVAVEYSSPNFLIKVGSLIECNGNVYAVTTADESVTAADGNLCFNETTGFYIDNSNTPVYDPARAGYYVSSTDRVTLFRVLASGLIYPNLDRSQNIQNTLFLSAGDVPFAVLADNNYEYISIGVVPKNLERVLTSWVSPFDGTIRINYIFDAINDVSGNVGVKIYSAGNLEATITWDSSTNTSGHADIPIYEGELIELAGIHQGDGSGAFRLRVEEMSFSAANPVMSHFMWCPNLLGHAANL